MAELGIFPFGEPVRKVEQTDRSRKRVFVLGVYSSAVHAEWLASDGRRLVTALAVCSEPDIFWRGEGAAELISRIRVPERVGRLVPAAARLNGPSGIALDDRILAPMGLARSDAWLCDLVCHSCVNPRQGTAIARTYLPLLGEHGLPIPSVPPVPRVLADSARRAEILGELLESGAEMLIVLGDQPLRWFLRPLAQTPSRLADFGALPHEYGRPHAVTLGGREIAVVPLAHPRQIARLGGSSQRWFDRHARWMRESARALARAATS
jgi:uracil-DNA glycosylase